MAISNYKSAQVELNVPNKVLGVSISAVNGHAYWDHANGSADPWYSGSGTKKYYQWTVTFSVTAQSHGSHLTRDDFTYNGLDIVVGDWIASATSGACWKVVSISAKTTNSVTAVVEDWLRYNTFKASTGNGAPSTGSSVIFSLNEKGIPMLDPLPGTVSSTFYPTLASRFEYLNPQQNYVLEQTSHGLSKGDIVSVSNTGFHKANTATMGKMIGVVTEAGPGPNQFMIMPNNDIIDFEPSIPGNQGDYVYISSTGTFTNSDTGKIAFLKIQGAIPTVLTGNINGPTVPSGHVIKMNDQTITFSGGGNVSATNMVSQINAVANTSVVASTTPTPTVIVSDGPNTIYGLVGGYVNFSAAFDTGSGNTTVSFTTSGSQYAGVSTPEDMKTDIDAASIANLSVSASPTVLTLTEANGNAITIVSVTNDNNGNPFVGASNVSGLNASTSATGTSIVKLTRSDGGPIDIFESTEFFRNNVGIASGHTGMFPLAMNIEQGIRTGGTTLVADISARNSLTAMTGDQAYVTNAGDGEWALYLYDGSQWVEISNQDSATVDAKTLTTTFTMPAGGFGNSTTNNLGNISQGRKIVSVSAEVHTAFTGYSGSIEPNIEVGTVADPDQFCDSPSNDLTETSDFMCFPEFIHPANAGQELIIRARCNHYTSSAGNVTVKVTYV
jgi:hypothetical protein|tara:strand:- start:1059 stop:3065 length:2007 start_codon:yes stop_codon:yes gene_type:complete